MSKEKIPVTPATRFLRSVGVAYTDHLYQYQEKGGTAVSARELVMLGCAMGAAQPTGYFFAARR